MRRICGQKVLVVLLGLWVASACVLRAGQAGALTPGDHTRELKVEGWDRSYVVHVPKNYSAKKPTPVVLALHGAMMDGPAMEAFCGMNATSEKNGFIVVYPSGTGLGSLLIWNSGGLKGRLAERQPDDVAFLRRVLDDLGGIVNVDTNRVYACGLSNGAMMCYRLAAEMSDRIVAIAPVAGTIMIGESRPKRPVPVLHFHGTEDSFVAYSLNTNAPAKSGHMMSVGASIQTWVRLDGCNPVPKVDVLSKPKGEMKVTRTVYGGGKGKSEVVLVTIEGGGHTWPGMEPPVSFLGKSAINVSANDLIWEFFRKYRLK